MATLWRHRVGREHDTFDMHYRTHTHVAHAPERRGDPRADGKHLDNRGHGAGYRLLQARAVRVGAARPGARVLALLGGRERGTAERRRDDDDREEVNVEEHHPGLVAVLPSGLRSKCCNAKNCRSTRPTTDDKQLIMRGARHTCSNRGACCTGAGTTYAVPASYVGAGCAKHRVRGARGCVRKGSEASVSRGPCQPT